MHAAHCSVLSLPIIIVGVLHVWYVTPAPLPDCALPPLQMRGAPNKVDQAAGGQLTLAEVELYRRFEALKTPSQSGAQGTVLQHSQVCPTHDMPHTAMFA